MRLNLLFPRSKTTIVALLLGGMVLTACGTDKSKETSARLASAHPDVLASFYVEIPEDLPGGTKLSIEWVDRLNGHRLSPEYQEMTPVDGRHFQLDVPSKKGSLLQYRYVRTGTGNEVELNSSGQTLASRFFHVTNHSRIEDSVIGFTNGDKRIPCGRLEGILQLSDSGQAAGDAIVTAAGVSTLAGIDGKFLLEGVPAGLQNVTVFSPDGAFEPFEQQAMIEENNVTPMDVELNPRSLVNVTFILKAPADTPPGASIRLFGDVSTLGDSFAGLFGGTSLSPNRGMPMARQSNRDYFAVAQVPAGTELHYMYSQGDTFWNGEVTPAGKTVQHTVFVDSQDMTLEDTVESWTTPNYEPVTFIFLPPAGTPETDTIQIQFNTFGWMDPIPMWPVGDGSYEFKLTNPLNFSAPVNYRYCRSDMCGTIDLSNNQEQILSFTAGGQEQKLQNTASNWTGWAPMADPTIVTTESTTPKEEGYPVGIELTDAFRPAWTPYFDATLNAVSGLNAGVVIIPVTWTYRSSDPVWLAPDLSRDPSLNDIQREVRQAREKGLKVYLMAQTRLPSTGKEFWNGFYASSSNWDKWFTSVSRFYHSTSLLASNVKADGLILGDEFTSRVLGGRIEVQEAQNAYPEDAARRWGTIFSESKTAYSGETWLALSMEEIAQQNPPPLDQIDGIYLLGLGAISDSTGDVKSYTEQVAYILDNTVEPFFSNYGKKAWIGLDFPSTATAYLGCVDVAGQCLSPSILNFPMPAQPDLPLSLQEQANLYNAALPEINRRDWINGVSSRRYLTTGNSQDQSSSVRGKPASDIIWYWFASMTGKPVQ